MLSQIFYWKFIKILFQICLNECGNEYKSYLIVYKKKQYAPQWFAKGL